MEKQSENAKQIEDLQKDMLSTIEEKDATIEDYKMKLKSEEKMLSTIEEKYATIEDYKMKLKSEEKMLSTIEEKDATIEDYKMQLKSENKMTTKLQSLLEKQSVNAKQIEDLQMCVSYSNKKSVKKLVIILFYFLFRLQGRLERIKFWKKQKN